MYNKGEPLYNFERDRFAFLKKWMDCKPFEMDAAKIIEDAFNLVCKYSYDELVSRTCSREILCCLATINERMNGK